ncbi:MAG: general stress protein CsbD [Alphaproteobacteria bacterium 41-28]|nr:MAG: general stress protein CsbD [Alphaproteobacteria bacterium 41-28]
MNKDIIKGKWHEIKGRVKQQWGKLTDDEISQINGSYEELEGILQKKYGYQKDEVEKEIRTFLDKNNWKDR